MVTAKKLLWGFLAVLVLACFIVYGAFWIKKSVSYSVYYKDMVEKTVREMVKPECLKPEYVRGRPETDP